MTVTEEIVTEDEQSTGVGRVVRVIGPVVDVEFGRNAMPALFTAPHPSRSSWVSCPRC